MSSSTSPIPRRPPGIPEGHILARWAIDCAQAFYQTRAFQTAEKVQNFKTAARLQLDLCIAMVRWEGTTDEEHEQRLHARFHDWVWPFVQWAIMRRAAIFRGGVWQIRPPQAVNAELPTGASRMRPRPARRPSSEEDSSVNVNDRPQSSPVLSASLRSALEVVDYVYTPPSFVVAADDVKKRLDSHSASGHVRKAAMSSLERLAKSLKSKAALHVKSRRTSSSMRGVSAQVSTSPQAPAYAAASTSSPPSSPIHQAYTGPSSGSSLYSTPATSPIRSAPRRKAELDSEGDSVYSMDIDKI
ncbi:hypothetical protein CYLTODRAFT_459538 [Cylindrobasidium torrendii FP15055 ss-10]|uniref:Uncharacterized protein n=1 Tax=Cylindrobasidium torrendii FP15055 ss-10 TaxID=1314674 RepID=A0A0D7ATX9_9AGAR|nr:hypothetical protein CYLTODRAFT_459538 [Cylindrobasidium torrendii FP15055 ss-10]